MPQLNDLNPPVTGPSDAEIGLALSTTGNAKPTTIPTMKSWVGAASGSFTLTKDSKILARDPALFNLATQLADDISAINGMELLVITSKAYQAVTGDIILNLDQRVLVPNLEGYKISADNTLTITGPAYNGVVFGTRSLLQVLALDGQKVNFPKGEATDYPDYRERGLVLDVGRKFFSKEFIKDYIRQLSYFKLNTLHLHLNDNKINPTSFNDYSAFRLKSNNPSLSGLAASDGSYTMTDWIEMEELAELYGVTIIPEIDAPAHALAFTKFKSGINLAGKYDELDLKNPETITFLKSIFAEFTPWFRSGTIQIGADEYQGSAVDYTNYVNVISEFLKGYNKTTRMWGSLPRMKIAPASVNQNIQIDAWSAGWYPLGKAITDGFVTANTNNNLLYLVPRGGLYHTVGLDNPDLYMSWTPDKVSYTTDANDTTPLNKNLLGAKMSVWNDAAGNGVAYTDVYVHQLIQPSLGVLGEKIWSATLTPTTGFGSFYKNQRILGTGPGLQVLTNMYPYTNKLGDLAYSKETSASSTYPGMGSPYVTDGLTTTRWASKTVSDTDWLQVDLGAVSSFTKVVLNWEAAYAKDYDIQVSNDGTTWTTVHQRRGLAKSGVDTINLATPASGRYVRMQGVTKGTSWAYSIYDFEVY